MVSSKGEKKENKNKIVARPVEQSTKKTAEKQLPTTEKKPAVSPRKSSKFPLRKKPSRMKASNMESSAIFPIETEAMESSMNNDDEEISARGATIVLSSMNVSGAPEGAGTKGAETRLSCEVTVPRPPATNFVPVVVKLDPEFSDPYSFFENVKVTKNMMILVVKRNWMPYFMSGDQVSAVNGVAVWNRRQLDRELTTCKAAETVENPVQVTVIRPWNISCPSKERLDRLVPPPDDRYQYFVVRVYLSSKSQGFTMTNERKRVFVTQIRSKANVSYALLIGDQILAIGEEVLANKGKKVVASQLRNMMDRSKRVGYAEITACRPISARSSPNPSVDAEMVEIMENLKALEKRAAATPPAGTAKTEKEPLENLNPPLESDALEIALRELCCFQQSIKPDAQLPKVEKGRSLVRAPGLTKTASTTNVAERSIYVPTSTTAASTATGANSAMTPRKMKKWKKAGRQNTITFKEQAETAKITSDIAEEADLKKCDPRSGIVAYIKSAFNN